MQSVRSVAITLLFSLFATVNAQTASPRIIGGDQAPVDRWPWMAQLLILDPAFPGQYLLCGASHLSDRWVLTAAHCLEYTDGSPADAENVFVFIGENARNDNPNAGIQAQQLLTHSEYTDTGNGLSHDLALIRIPATSNTQWPSFISPDLQDALDQAPFSERDESVTALGWGQTDNGNISSTLQEVQLDYIPLPRCRDLSPLIITDFVVCAAERNPINEQEQDSCFGDSGGPLFLGRDPSPWLAGITSFGQSTCATGAPGGYTRVVAETGELESLTASAGLPLVDLNLFWSFPPAPARFYQPPGGSQDLVLTLENTGSNTINNPTLSLSLTGETSATAQWDNCSTGLFDNDCTPVATFTGSRTQALTVNGNNDPDQAVTVLIQGSSDEDDYRRRNNRLEQQVVFSNKPDLALSAEQIASTTRSADIRVTLQNLSTLNAASGTRITFTLPLGITLGNGASLGCTGSSPTQCPLGNLAADTSASLVLELASDDGAARTLTIDGQATETDFPAGDTRQSLTVTFTDTSSSSPSLVSSDSGGGSLWYGLLLTGLALGLRRRPCSLP